MPNHSLCQGDLPDRIDSLIRLRWLTVIGTLLTVGLLNFKP
jgi:hypothetical protein